MEGREKIKRIDNYRRQSEESENKKLEESENLSRRRNGKWKVTAIGSGGDVSTQKEKPTRL